MKAKKKRSKKKSAWPVQRGWKKKVVPPPPPKYDNFLNYEIFSPTHGRNYSPKSFGNETLVGDCRFRIAFVHCGRPPNTFEYAWPFVCVCAPNIIIYIVYFSSWRNFCQIWLTIKYTKFKLKTLWKFGALSSAELWSVFFRFCLLEVGCCKMENFVFKSIFLTSLSPSDSAKIGMK